MCQDGKDSKCCCCCCFSKDTLIYVKENNNIVKKPISEIKENDLILTLKNGKKCFSKVETIVYCENEFEFYKFYLMKDGKTKSITVTPNHIMMVYNKDKNDIKFKSADSVVKNIDYFNTLDGLYQIIDIKKFKMKYKYDIKVEENVIIADDILVTCLKINQTPKALLEDISEKYRMIMFA